MTLHPGGEKTKGESFALSLIEMLEIGIFFHNYNKFKVFCLLFQGFSAFSIILDSNVRVHTHEKAWALRSLHLIF